MKIYYLGKRFRYYVCGTLLLIFAFQQIFDRVNEETRRTKKTINDLQSEIVELKANPPLTVVKKTYVKKVYVKKVYPLPVISSPPTPPEF